MRNQHIFWSIAFIATILCEISSVNCDIRISNANEQLNENVIIKRTSESDDSTPTLRFERRPLTDPHKRISYKCVITELGHFNEVNVLYRFDGKNDDPANKTYVYFLKLGDEEYYKSAYSKRRAQEAVSQEAMQMTKHRHPHLDNVIQACTFTYSAMTLVHEWAQQYRRQIAYNTIEISAENPPRYTIECRISPNITTQGQAFDKASARQEAAEKMLNYLKSMVLREVAFSTSIHNATYMNPVTRLHEIVASDTHMEPIYRVVDKAELTDAVGHKHKIFQVNVSVDQMTAIGFGRTIKDARREASKNMLKLMHYDVA